MLLSLLCCAASTKFLRHSVAISLIKHVHTTQPSISPRVQVTQKLTPADYMLGFIGSTRVPGSYITMMELTHVALPERSLLDKRHFRIIENMGKTTIACCQPMLRIHVSQAKELYLRSVPFMVWTELNRALVATLMQCSLHRDNI